MGFIDWMYKVTGHADLDEQEERFKYGDKVEIVNGFFRGQKATILKLHTATSLSHGWVGYWVKLDNDYEPKDAIPVDDIKLLENIGK